MQQFFDTLIDKQGNVVPGALVRVTNKATGLPAPLFSTAGGTPITGALLTGALGEYAFYAANGRYQIDFSLGNKVFQGRRDVLLYDPEDAGGIPARVDALETSSALLGTDTGAGMVGFKQAGTGAVSRTVQDKLRDAVSVKDFGARGDGVSDDTDAIEDALTSRHRGCVFFPAGTYRITRTIKCEARYIRMMGESIQATVIACDLIGDGFSFGSISPSGTVEVSDMSIRTLRDNPNAAAVRISMAGAGIQTINPSCIIERVEARAEAVDTQQWQHGFHIKNAATSVFRDLLIFGASNQTPDSQELAKSSGITVVSDKLAVINVFENIFSINTNFGIQVLSGGSKGSEGIYIRTCNAVNCNYGYYVKNSNAGGYVPVQVSVLNNHAEFYKYGVVVDAFGEVIVNDNLLYAYDYPGDIARQAILINNCYRGTIRDNNTHSNGNNITLEGIRLLGNTDRFNVFDNINNTPSWGVVFGSLTKHCREGGNVQRHSSNLRFSNEAAASSSNYSAPFKMIAGSTVTSLDENGYGEVQMHGFGSTPVYLVNNGDSNTHGDKIFSVFNAGCTPSKLAFRVYPNPGATPVRVNWVASAPS